jgi:hypothetical protein
MTYYRLYLKQDRRTQISYHHFVGATIKERPYYVRKLKLWDLLARKYLSERVLLLPVETKDKIIIVEVADGLL